MITINRISLKHFMSIDALDISFPDDCMVAITGENGSGKSALLYAIAFAITGYRKGESYRDYVQTGQETAEIHLEATLKGYPVIYDIEIVGNYKKGQVAPTKKKVTYKDKVYLNSDYSQFIKEYELDYIESLMFLFQGSDDIINTRPGDRAAMLRKLFQFEFTDIVNMFKDKQEQLKLKNIEVASKINELNTQIFEKQSLIRTLTKEGLEAKKQQLFKVNSSLSNIANIDEASIVKYEEWLKSTTQSLSSDKIRLQEDITNKTSCENNLKKSNEAIKDIDAEAITVKIENLELEKSNIEDRISELNHYLESQSKDISVLEFNVKELRKQVAVCETGICHACGHKIDEAHTEKIREELTVTLRKLKELTTQFDDLKNEVGAQNNLKQPIIKEINELQSALKLRDQELRKIELFKTKLENLEASIADRSRTIERLEQDKSRIESEKLELDKLKPLLEQRKELEKSKEALESVIKKTEEDWIRNEEKKTSNEAVARNARLRDSRIREFSEEQNQINLDMGTAKECIEIFDNLFPNYIILQACEQLEDYINSIVQRMFPYMRVSLKLNRKGVNFYYLSESSGEEWIAANMASGAQKTILSLAYKIALAKMYGLTAIFLDEADAAMSDENARIVYDFISSLEDFQQVFSISHRKEAVETMMDSGRSNVILYKVDHGEYEQL